MALEYHPPASLRDRAPQDLVWFAQGTSMTYLYRHVKKKIINQKTIVVFIDGACSGNGRSDGSACAGVGVYFGPGSRHNISERIEGAQTNQRAEILSAIRALEVVRKALIPPFLVFPQEITITRVVLVSDSKYVVNAMTDWVYKWVQNGWKNAKGEMVTNRKEFKRLYEIIGGLEQYGVGVQFWNVERRENGDADRLAKQALTLPLSSPEVVCVPLVHTVSPSPPPLRTNLPARNVQTNNSLSLQIGDLGFEMTGYACELGSHEEDPNHPVPSIHRDRKLMGNGGGFRDWFEYDEEEDEEDEEYEWMRKEEEEEEEALERKEEEEEQKMRELMAMGLESMGYPWHYALSM